MRSIIFPGWAISVIAARALTLFAVCASVSLAQQSPLPPPLPGAATPGGALPQQSRFKMLQPETEMVAIPAFVDRPMGIGEGQAIVVREFLLKVDPDLERRADAVLQIRSQSFLDARISKQPESGFSVRELEEMTRAVSTIYRDDDFILARAFLPEQVVTDGVVVVEVLAGELDQVTVEGNERYSDGRVTQPFAELMGKPVRKSEIESAMLSLSDYPGLAPEAEFVPSATFGATDLAVKVAEQRIDLRTSVDNYGTDYTGNGRARAVLDWFNPVGIGDVFSANILQTFDPDEGTYGGVGYQLPLDSYDWTLAAAYSRNTYDVSGSQAGIPGLGGDSDIGTVFLRHQLRRSQSFSASAYTGLSIKQATIDNLTADGDDPEDNLTIVSFGVDLEGSDRLGSGGLNQLILEFHRGLNSFLGSMDEDGDEKSTRRGGSGDYAGGDFNKWILQFQRLQRISANNTLLARLFYQQSDDLLTSLEQFAMGGPYSVRAYPTSEVLVDKGGFFSLEWMLDLTGLRQSPPRDWQVQVALFGDYAGGKDNDPLPGEEEDFDLSGWGAGLQFDLEFANGQALHARVDGATQLTSRDPSNGDDWQWWGRLEYRFW